MFLDNKQERDHLCAFDLGANYHKFNTLEKGYSDLFLHVFIKIWEINFYKRFVVVKWCSHSDRGSKKEWSKSWVIWKPRVSSFLLIYIYVTQVLTIKLLSSFSEFTQRRPQFLPLSGLWVSSASTWYYKNCCSSYLTFDFLWSSHSVSVAYLWVNMVNDFSVFLTIGVFFPRNCC